MTISAGTPVAVYAPLADNSGAVNHDTPFHGRIVSASTWAPDTYVVHVDAPINRTCHVHVEDLLTQPNQREEVRSVR